MNQHRRLQIAEECVVFDSPGIAHAVKRTPRTLMRRRNIVSSRGARDLVKHSVRTRKSRSCELAAFEDTRFTSPGIHRLSHLDSRTSAFIFELNQAIVRGVATSRKRPVPARTASHLDVELQEG